MSALALRRILPALAVAGLALGLLAGYLVVESDHTVGALESRHYEDTGVTAALALLLGWSFIGTGLFAWWRRPENRTGALMTAAGFAWLAACLAASDNNLLLTIGISLDAMFAAVLVHLLLAFPGGRLETRIDRLVVAAVYGMATVLQLPSLLFEDNSRNLLVIERDQDLSDLLDVLQFAIGAPAITVGVVIATWRRRAVAASQRPALLPVLLTGGVSLTVFGIAQGFDTAGSPHEWLDRLSLLTGATMPFGFLVGLLRSRLAQGAAVSELIAKLGQTPGEDALRSALAEALADPSLRLAYWLPEPERFVDAAGRAVELQEGHWTEVSLHGRRIAAIVHDPALADDPQLVRAAGAAAALALENQRLAAELRARIVELRESRARLVTAGDAERRRLERDLHDGAQSRLVALALKLRLARMKVDGSSEAATLLDESAAELAASLTELRELARGIHPPVLTEQGLDPALRTLAGRAPVPVDVDCEPPPDLSGAVETAIYFVVSEALTNVAKYAHADRATVRVAAGPDCVVVEVSDDGVGGAQAGSGSGLRGLADRIGALDGRLEIDSPPGAGTRLRAELPLA